MLNLQRQILKVKESRPASLIRIRNQVKELQYNTTLLFTSTAKRKYVLEAGMCTSCVIIDLTVYMQVRILTLDQKRNARMQIYKSGTRTNNYYRLETTFSYLTS